MKHERMLKQFLIALAVIAALLGGTLLQAQNNPLISREIWRMPPPRSYLIQFGINDKEPTVWDGKISVSGGRILEMAGWRFAGTDAIDNLASWRISTRRAPATGNQTLGQMLENGLIVTGFFDDYGAKLSIETTQGSFTFGPRNVPYGSAKTFLTNRVRVEQVPRTRQLTESEEEQDFPALAQSGNDVWLSYVEFVHGDRSQNIAGQFATEPSNFDFLARPVGGDQVFLQRYSVQERAWDAPIPVTPSNQDVMRTAVAVDAQGRIWVIWSAKQDANFDLFARSYWHKAWSSQIRLTTDPGPDLNPIAVTDARGRIWIAWQGFRNNNLEILAIVFNGDNFTQENIVSFSPASDWDPAIAASPNGDIAISWDTYDKGDYDVYFRRLRYEGSIRMDASVPVAASENFEARSSVAFDPQNRLWIAYEGANIKWGKDFGAYEKSGVALYQGEYVRLKCFQGTDAFNTSAKLTISGTLNSFPRLAIAANGVVYLTYRARTTGRPSIGSIWLQYLKFYDGNTWSGPVTLPHTDGLLDLRPAVTALANGTVMMVAPMDHRLSQLPGSRAGDWSNTDLYSVELNTARESQTAQFIAMPAETVSQSPLEVRAETLQIAGMHEYRATIGGQTFQLLRGEFHRHTEMSGDGGSDGPLIDAYRYLIDSAYMDWGGCCDHDNGNRREYFWWQQQKLTDAYKLGEKFIPMFSYERSVVYPEGHRNIVFAQRGIRPLPRLPVMAADSTPTPAPDTQMLYHYLKQFKGIVASHTSATDMGTDWRDNDPILEPVVEIYQGDRQNYEMPDAPRAPTADNAIGGWRPLGFVSLALQKGYRLGFQASSDHISTHMSYCNVWATAPTRSAILEGLSKRRVYGATDNILADVRCGEHFMGEEFTLSEPPTLTVKLMGTAEFAKVFIVRNGAYVYSVEPKKQTVDFQWRDTTAERGKLSYYYVRGEQSDGELVWVSPMWILYQ